MKCVDAVGAEVFTCYENDTVRRCAELMRERNIGLVPIVNVANEVMGVVTDRDLAIRVIAAGLPLDTPASKVMTRELVCCAPEDELGEAEVRMGEAKKSRVLIVGDAGRCAGVISLSDIARIEGKRRSGKVLQAVSERESESVV